MTTHQTTHIPATPAKLRSGECEAGRDDSSDWEHGCDPDHGDPIHDMDAGTIRCATHGTLLASA